MIQCGSELKEDHRPSQVTYQIDTATTQIPNMASRNFFIGSAIALAFARLVSANPAAAAITEGPQAYVSYESLAAFSTLKPCAQGCLRYNGPYHCMCKFLVASMHHIPALLTCAYLDSGGIR